jgi:uncharacterized protein
LLQGTGQSKEVKHGRTSKRKPCADLPAAHSGPVDSRAYGFAGSTLIVAAHLAGWYGTPVTPVYVVPFTAFFGGLAQFLAGMWAYRVRDAIATAMHGMWGAFWMGLGVLEVLTVGGVIPPNEGAFPALGFWFIALAWITLMETIAASGRMWRSL